MTISWPNGINHFIRFINKLENKILQNKEQTLSKKSENGSIND